MYHVTASCKRPINGASPRNGSFSLSVMCKREEPWDRVENGVFEVFLYRVRQELISSQLRQSFYCEIHTKILFWGYCFAPKHLFLIKNRNRKRLPSKRKDYYLNFDLLVKTFCLSICHFTVVYSATRPMNGSEAASDLVLIQTSLFLSCKSCCCEIC